MQSNCLRLCRILLHFLSNTFRVTPSIEANRPRRLNSFLVRSLELGRGRRGLHSRIQEFHSLEGMRWYKPESQPTNKPSIAAQVLRAAISASLKGPLVAAAKTHARRRASNLPALGDWRLRLRGNGPPASAFDFCRLLILLSHSAFSWFKCDFRDKCSQSRKSFPSSYLPITCQMCPGAESAKSCPRTFFDTLRAAGQENSGILPLRPQSSARLILYGAFKSGTMTCFVRTSIPQAAMECSWR